MELENNIINYKYYVKLIKDKYFNLNFKQPLNGHYKLAST